MNKIKITLPALCFMLLLRAGLFAQQTHYYNIQGADITLLTSWTTNPDATGDNPPDFTSDNAIFHIYHNSQLMSDLTISGENSRMIVGDSINNIELGLAPGVTLDALVDLKRFGALSILSNNYPTFGNFEDGSAVSFALSSSKTIPYHSYFNLNILGINPVFEDPGGDIVIRGTLTLQGSVTFPQARDNVEYNMIFNGDGDQEIITNDNVLRSFNLIINKQSGRFGMDPSGAVSADNNVEIILDEAALFSDNEATIYAGNSVVIGGTPNHEFLGTLVLAGTQSGIVNGAPAGSSYLLHDGESGNIPVSLHNLTIHAQNAGGEFVISDGTTGVITINGNLTLLEGADGNVNFGENEVIIKGNFAVEEGFQGDVQEIKKLNVGNDEGNDQGLIVPGGVDVLEIEIYNNLNVTGLLNVHGTITLNESNVFASGHARLIIHEGAQMLGYDDVYNFDIPLGYVLSNTEAVQMVYPLSDNGIYRELILEISHTVNEPVLYIAELHTVNMPDYNLDEDLEEVYSDFFFQFNIEGTETSIDSIRVGLPVEATIPELDTELLRIALSENQIWENAGGVMEENILFSETNYVNPDTQIALAKYLPSGSKMITSFNFVPGDQPENFALISGPDIDQENLTISAEVNDMGTYSLVPAIEHTGVSISPGTGVAQDFSYPVEYTVTAEDNSTAVYTVNVIFSIVDNIENMQEEENAPFVFYDGASLVIEQRQPIKGEMKIFDISGNQVFASSLDKSSEQRIHAGLQPGIYLLQISPEDTNQVFVQKVAF